MQPYDGRRVTALPSASELRAARAKSTAVRLGWSPFRFRYTVLREPGGFCRARTTGGAGGAPGGTRPRRARAIFAALNLIASDHQHVERRARRHRGRPRGRDRAGRAGGGRDPRRRGEPEPADAVRARRLLGRGRALPGDAPEGPPERAVRRRVVPRDGVAGGQARADGPGDVPALRPGRPEGLVPPRERDAHRRDVRRAGQRVRAARRRGRVGAQDA